MLTRPAQPRAASLLAIALLASVLASPILAQALPPTNQSQQSPSATQATPVVATTPITLTSGSIRSSFYRVYQVSPIGNGEKVLITLDAGAQKYTIVAEPVAPKDGGPVTQYALYSNGGVTLYSKTQITLPNPNGGEGTLVDGMSVAKLPMGDTPAPSTGPQVAVAGHQSTSTYTTAPRKSDSFKFPMRFDKPGFAPRPRLWLIWDGQREIQVEPVDANYGGLKSLIPIYNIEQWATGNLNHLKFLSNAYTEGSPAPRYFYMKKNKDDSITVYGNDDLDKLKAIEKGKKP